MGTYTEQISRSSLVALRRCQIGGLQGEVFVKAGGDVPGWEVLRAGDEAGSGVEGGVGPGPFGEDGDAGAGAGEGEEVDEQPWRPRAEDTPPGAPGPAR